MTSFREQAEAHAAQLLQYVEDNVPEGPPKVNALHSIKVGVAKAVARVERLGVKPYKGNPDEPVAVETDPEPDDGSAAQGPLAPTIEPVPA